MHARMHAGETLPGGQGAASSTAARLSRWNRLCACTAWAERRMGCRGSGRGGSGMHAWGADGGRHLLSRLCKGAGVRLRTSRGAGRITATAAAAAAAFYPSRPLSEHAAADVAVSQVFGVWSGTQGWGG
eukprot:357210-Chlamydomonas_euryale.AAC.2